jgi:hypothetical protein
VRKGTPGLHLQGIMPEVTNPRGQPAIGLNMFALLFVAAALFPNLGLYSEAVLCFMEAAMSNVEAAILSIEDRLPIRNIRACCDVMIENDLKKHFHLSPFPSLFRPHTLQNI